MILFRSSFIAFLSKNYGLWAEFGEPPTLGGSGRTSQFFCRQKSEPHLTSPHTHRSNRKRHSPLKHEKALTAQTGKGTHRSNRKTLTAQTGKGTHRSNRKRRNGSKSRIVNAADHRSKLFKHFQIVTNSRHVRQPIKFAYLSSSLQKLITCVAG